MFKDSCVTAITPWSLREEATWLPTHIFPVYIGSGSVAMPIDASGLQGLNHGAQEVFKIMPNTGDMYLVKNGMVGDQISESNVLPLGFLSWELELDGTVINAANLIEHAGLWRRDILIDESRVVTTMLLDLRLGLTIAAWIPFGTSSPVFEVTLQSRKYAAEQVVTHDVKFKLGIDLRTRQGVRLYDRCAMSDAGLALRMPGKELYNIQLRVETLPALETEKIADWYGLAWQTTVNDVAQTLTCLLRVNDGFGVGDIAEQRRRHQQSWREHYQALAAIDGLDEKETFLYHNSLHLLRAGFDYSMGVTIGAPFYQLLWWRASTFWDSNQIMDGLMRAGDIAHTYQFLALLLRAMQPAGKPFPWIFQYDTQSSIEDERDIAPLVIAAHAATAIKAYEYYRHPEILERFTYPICRRVGDYAVSTLFGYDGAHWILAAPVSNDVVEEEASEINQTHTVLWFLAVLKKTVEYAGLLGQAADLDPRYGQILANYHLESTDEEYLQSRGVRAADCAWASWIPFLLYPTEGMPFVDADLFRKTRARYNFTALYLEKQGSDQPWTCFMQAASDLRAALPEAAYGSLQTGLRYVYGPGYFCEINPQQQTGGLPPYVSAHGAYIVALFYLFVADTIWEKRISILAHTPQAYRDRAIAIRDLYCSGGIKLDLQSRPHELRAVFAGDLQGYELLFRRPKNVQQRDLRVLVNGTPAASRHVGEDGVVSVCIQETQPNYEIILR